MTRPLVSVLLPVWNAEPFLSQALASLVAQTVADLEIIAVDDGSTDGSAVLLDEWARRDTRIRVIRSEHRGIVAALETARAEAEAPFLARMDADDRCDPRRLAEQLRLLETEPDLVGCGTHVRYFPRGRITDGALRYEEWLCSVRTPEGVDANLYVECPLAHPTFFLRTEAVSAAGGYRDAGWPEDYDLLFRLREVGPLGVVPHVLLEWRDTPDRLSRIDAGYGQDAFRACKIEHLLRSFPHRSFVIWGAGPVGKAFGRALIGRGATVRAFVDLDPRKIGQEIHGATVMEPAEISADTDALFLAAVGQRGAREEIREALSDLGLREGTDFLAVA